MTLPDNPQLIALAATQDAIKKAILDSRRPDPSAMKAAQIAEQEREAVSAEACGVNPEEYRKWASGLPMPDVDTAVRAWVAGRK